MSANKRQPSAAKSGAPKKPATEDDVNQKAIINQIQYTQSSKCTNPAAKEQGRLLAEAWNGIQKHQNPQMTNEFVKRFFDTRKSKDFTWMKSFSEKFLHKETENTGMKENYMTPCRAQS